MKNRKALAALVAAAFLFLSGAAVQAVSEAELQQMKQEMKALQQRLEQMQKLIEKQEKTLQAVEEKQEATERVKAEAKPSPGATTETGVSRALNPAISVNGLLLGATVRNDREDSQEPGLFIQEVEILATAFVDPNVKGNLTAAFHRGHHEEAGGHPDGLQFELEEFYFDIFGLPAALQSEGSAGEIEGVSARIGKSFVPFGKSNPLHTHQLPFIDRPIVTERIFGEEKLNEVLAMANISFPVSYFLEFQGAIMDGANEVLFNSPRSNDLAGFLRAHTVLDMTADTTVELGGSYTWGKDEELRQNHVFGGDLTLKSVRGLAKWPHQVIWTTEYVQNVRDEGMGMEDRRQGGVYTGLQVQVHRNWWLQARYDYFGIPKLESAHEEDEGEEHHEEEENGHDDHGHMEDDHGHMENDHGHMENDHGHMEDDHGHMDAHDHGHGHGEEYEGWRATFLAALVPNEFSAIRFQYSYTHDDNPDVKDGEHEFLIQFNYTFGSHPAHLY